MGKLVFKESPFPGDKCVTGFVPDEQTDKAHREATLFPSVVGWTARVDVRYRLNYDSILINSSCADLDEAKRVAQEWFDANSFPECCLTERIKKRRALDKASFGKADPDGWRSRYKN
jgi:hypothetical protein